MRKLAAVFIAMICLLMTNVVSAERHEFNGHHYEVFDIPLDWVQAQQYCWALGGNLAAIESAEEQRFVESLLGIMNCYWLGGIRDYNRGWDWYWMQPYEKIRYTNWAPGQPDNYCGAWEQNLQSGEHVLMMYNFRNPNAHAAKGEWNDIRPDGECAGDSFYGVQNFGFICEWAS